jgi:hypothetical protein
MQSTGYVQPTSVQTLTAGFAAPRSDFYATLAETLRAPARSKTMVQTIERGISIDDVCELLSAAGPLSAGDIAGGLDVSVREASNYVGFMVAHGDLQEDEFGRYRLRGSCAARA